MTTLYVGRTLNAGAFSGAGGLLAEINSAWMYTATNPRGQWAVVSQSDTTLVLRRNFEDVGINERMTVTISGTGFTFDSPPTGSVVAPTGGTVTDIALDYHSENGRPAAFFVNDWTAQGTSVPASLADLMVQGLSFDGDDVIVGTSFHERQTGFLISTFDRISYDQSINAGAGTDFVFAGIGNDTVDGGSGWNYLDGGDGFDIYSVASATFGQYVHLGLGTTTTHDTFVNFEGVLGSSHADFIAGRNDADDKLYGGAGSDVLAGGSGQDELYGGADNDRLYVEWSHYLNYGADRLDGGGGFDVIDLTLVVPDSAIYLYVDLESGYNFAGNTLVSIEGIVGGDGHDTLLGNGEANRFEGGGDGDIIVGRAGDDTIWGGTGADALFLGDGADTLVVNSVDLEAGVFDYVGDFTPADIVRVDPALQYSLYAFDYAGTAYVIAATGGSYWGIGFDGDITAAQVMSRILYA